MRFISAQLDAYLENDRWLAQARAANALATRLASNLAAIPEVEIAEAAEANEVFAFLPDPIVARLREAGAKFYDWAEPREGRTLVRLVLSFLTPDDDVQRFIQVAQR
jgi:threonine aldolase